MYKRQCYALQQIRLPDSVYLLGEAAFSYMPLHQFVFPEKIVSVSYTHLDVYKRQVEEQCAEAEAVSRGTVDTAQERMPV